MMLNTVSRTIARFRRLDRHRITHVSRRLLGYVQGDDYARLDGRCRHAPEWLILGINNVCNLHCKMCDVGLGERGTTFWANLIGDNPHNMTLELLHEILRQGGAFRPRPYVSMGTTEPLIHPQILEFARAIVSQGFYCVMVSNGTMLPRLATQLVEIGVHEIMLSVDGPAAIHNRIRGGRESFEKAYRGAELISATRTRLRRRYPKVRFSFTVNDENYNHILDFIQAIEPLQPDAIHISHLNFITEGMAAAHNAGYGGDLAVARSNLGVMDPGAFDTGAIWAELERVSAYVRSRGAAFPTLTFSPKLDSRHGVDTFYRKPLTPVTGPGCTDPWKMMMIKTDGTVIPAHSRCYNFPIGNIQSSSLQDLWNNERFRTFRQTLRRAGGTLPACSRCCGVLSKPLLAREPTYALDPSP
jgi:MoaA/NifB/PqqE/SkfB family radical SAM enzyme